MPLKILSSIWNLRHMFFPCIKKEEVIGLTESEKWELENERLRRENGKMDELDFCWSYLYVGNEWMFENIEEVPDLPLEKVKEILYHNEYSEWYYDDSELKYLESEISHDVDFKQQYRNYLNNEYEWGCPSYSYRNRMENIGCNDDCARCWEIAMGIFQDKYLESKVPRGFWKVCDIL